MLRNFIFVGKKKAEYYHGLRMKTDTGLHEQVAHKLHQLVPQSGAKILDYGAGEGALSERLSRMGYIVTAVDTNRTEFKCKRCNFDQVNFDDPDEFSRFVVRNESTFDVVLSVEVIEHVQDQWGYVRQLMKLVRPSGLVLITTPHISSWLSRFTFFFTGQFSSFDTNGLTYGHINPVSPWELRLIMEGCGAQDVVIEPAGTLPPLYFVPTREVLINFLVLPFRLFMRGLLDGWCVMATARRPLQHASIGEIDDREKFQ